MKMGEKELERLKQTEPLDMTDRELLSWIDKCREMERHKDTPRKVRRIWMVAREAAETEKARRGLKKMRAGKR
jgi:succinate dehydrogenase flavin-adding protein (antitoxin of CptAB toxin-antitoxin module)